MQINGSLPAHIARAYRVPTAPAPQLQSAVQPGAPVQGVGSSDVSQIVAAKVSQPIEFGGEPLSPSRVGALPLYTRAADKVEAAVAVQLGSTLDIRG